MSIWAKLLQRKNPTNAYALPPSTRVYAIGDIHGRLDLLEKLHQQIAEHLQQKPTSSKVYLIHLGDYVDRGLYSNGVIERLSTLQLDGVNSVINLMGNHEDLLLHFLNNPETGRAWLQLGGDATLLSYGVGITPQVAPADRFEAIRDDFLEKMPAHHLDFLKNLNRYQRIGDYLFVHAGLFPNRHWERQRPEDFIWIRQQFTESRADHGAMVVHGHHITETPDEQPNRVGVDTGAYFSGILTALVQEGSERSFISTAP